MVRKTAVGLFTFWYQLTSLKNSLLVLACAIGAWVLAIVGWVRARREDRMVWPLLLPVFYLNILLALLLALGRYCARSCRRCSSCRRSVPMPSSTMAAIAPVVTSDVASVTCLWPSRRRDAMNTVSRNLSWLLLSQLATWAMTLLVILLVPRYLGASGFGEFTFVVAYVGFFQLAGGLGTSIFMTREIARDPRSSARS